MSRPLHIVFAGGATLNQLHPGLAVAAQVAERFPEAAVTFVGQRRSQEHHAVRAAGFTYAHLPSQPEPRNALHAVRFVTDNVAGYWASRWYLKEQYVSLVVGLGGSASAATVRAAISRRIPTLLLEQNVVPGHVTRWLAPLATTVCVGFQQSSAYFPSSVTVRVTGNPARPAFEQLYRQRHCRVDAGDFKAVQSHTPAREKRLIIIGGAGGARSLNESMPAALKRLGDRLGDWQIVHQSGEGQLQETVSRYRDAGVDALVVAYIDEMAAVMFEADLVVCRPAGTTLAELALAGVPAIVVPYPPAMEQQLPNAEVYAAGGAATILDESDLERPLDTELAAKLEPLVADESLRHKMATQMHRFACPDAAVNVTDTMDRILHGNSTRFAA